MFLQTYIHKFICNFLWNIWKWLLHKVTGKCELLRITEFHENDAQMVTKIGIDIIQTYIIIECSINGSKSPIVRNCIKNSNPEIMIGCVHAIADLKKVPDKYFTKYFFEILSPNDKASVPTCITA